MPVVSSVLISCQFVVSQTLIASLIVTSFLPSALKAIKETPSADMKVDCPPPASVCNSRPEIASQTFTELLPAAAASKRLSALKATTGAKAR